MGQTFSFSSIVIAIPNVVLTRPVMMMRMRIDMRMRIRMMTRMRMMMGMPNGDTGAQEDEIEHEG